MLVVMGGLIVLWLCAGEPGTQSGTTPNIKEIAMGRCYDYVTRVKPGLRYDCEDIWRRFEEAVGRQAPCNVTVEDYGRMFYAMAQTWAPPCGRFLFWSKTKTFVQTLVAALRHFWTLEDTLAGFMFNDLLWCGREDEAGFDFGSCPGWSACQHHPVYSLWRRASQKVSARLWFPRQSQRRPSAEEPPSVCRIGLRERHRAAERIRRPGLQQEQHVWQRGAGRPGPLQGELRQHKGGERPGGSLQGILWSRIGRGPDPNPPVPRFPLDLCRQQPDSEEP